MTSFQSQLLMSKLRKAKTLKEKGFTLVELMVVIIIVGILGAVAMPNFLGAADRAKVAAANSAVSSVITACEVAIASGLDASADAEVVRLEALLPTDAVAAGTVTTGEAPAQEQLLVLASLLMVTSLPLVLRPPLSEVNWYG